METLLKALFQYILLPLLKDGLIDLIAWFKKKRIADEKKKQVDEDVKKFKEAPSVVEKQKAFKDLVRGTRERAR